MCCSGLQTGVVKHLLFLRQNLFLSGAASNPYLCFSWHFVLFFRGSVRQSCHGRIWVVVAEPVVRQGGWIGASGHFAPLQALREVALNPQIIWNPFFLGCSISQMLPVAFVSAGWPMQMLRVANANAQNSLPLSSPYLHLTWNPYHVGLGSSSMGKVSATFGMCALWVVQIACDCEQRALCRAKHAFEGTEHEGSGQVIICWTP